MKNKGIDNTKVGLLVLSGLVFLVLMLYMIGKNRNLLGSTFTITALVNNVNGLVPGNNVRFKGIDVGTVKSISVTNDTLISVTMLIDEKMKPYIRKNAIASIGTDGLMGNKLVNINSTADDSAAIEEGDVIRSRQPVETDEMLRTLNTTNDNIEKITRNLYEITTKLNRSESLWTLLSDTVITHDLKNAVVDVRNAASNTANLTSSAKGFVQKLEQGNGLATRVFTDTTLSNQLEITLHMLELTSRNTSIVTAELKSMMEEMKQGGGTAGLLLSDTVLRQNLSNSAVSIEEGTARFNQNMEALRTNFLFKKYFKKLEKQQQRESTKAGKD